MRAAVDDDLVPARGQPAGDLLDGRLEAAVGGGDARACRGWRRSCSPELQPAYTPPRGPRADAPSENARGALAAARAPARRAAPRVAGEPRQRVGQRRRVARIEVARGVAAHLVTPGRAHGEHGRRPRAIASSAVRPKPSCSDGCTSAAALGVAAPPARGRRVRLDAHAVPGRPRRAGEHERRSGGRRPRAVARVGGEQQVEVLARLVVADVEEVRAARPRSGRGGSSWPGPCGATTIRSRRRPSSATASAAVASRHARPRRRRGAPRRGAARRAQRAEARVEALRQALEGEVVDGDHLRRAARGASPAAGGGSRRAPASRAAARQLDGAPAPVLDGVAPRAGAPAGGRPPALVGRLDHLDAQRRAAPAPGARCRRRSRSARGGRTSCRSGPSSEGRAEEEPVRGPDVHVPEAHVLQQVAQRAARVEAQVLPARVGRLVQPLHAGRGDQQAPARSAARAAPR